ncbi:Cerato-platanin [Auriculariales sp. MPI-PUGE-AT-0066]|nr:Cerato-platanin [Auriculariales sp. MPI-PUGE-AT-0066]
MRLSLLTTALATPAVFAAIASTSYDTAYDNSTLKTTSLACSDGENGLIPRGYTTLGQLPTFPNVGGGFPVEGWNSVNCGVCYKLTYKGRSVNITVVDHADGFNIAKAAMNTLTNNQAVSLGRVNATYIKIDDSWCGLASA